MTNVPTSIPTIIRILVCNKSLGTRYYFTSKNCISYRVSFFRPTTKCNIPITNNISFCWNSITKYLLFTTLNILIIVIVSFIKVTYIFSNTIMFDSNCIINKTNSCKIWSKCKRYITTLRELSSFNSGIYFCFTSNTFH